MTRPKLLMLVQTLPFPPDGGVHIRTFHTIRLLSRMFDITALCFYRKAERPTAADVAASIEGLRPYARVEAFPIPQEHNGARLTWDHLRSVAGGQPYTWHAYESSAMRARVQQALARQSFDLVHIDSLDLACYLPLFDGLPVVCAHHNVESALLRRRAAAETGVARRYYLAHQADLLERLERTWLGRVTLNISVSAVDQAALETLAPGAVVIPIPNGVDVQQFQPSHGTERGIISVGGVNWFPNRDALTYLCTDILPAVRRESGAPRVQWVGRATDDEREHYRRDHQVDLTGYVDDVRPFVRDAACFVVPLRVGGGTRLKILDAWAMGKAVVSTAVGCEGLDAVNGENILIRDTATGFASAVSSVLRDAGLRARLGAAGRATVEATYSWEVIGHTMLQAYATVCADSAASQVTDDRRKFA